MRKPSLTEARIKSLAELVKVAPCTLHTIEGLEYIELLVRYCLSPTYKKRRARLNKAVAKTKQTRSYPKAWEYKQRALKGTSK